MNGHSNGTAVGTAHGELTSHQRQYLSKMLAQLAMSQGERAVSCCFEMKPICVPL